MASAVSVPSVTLWVKAELFTIGVIPQNPLPRLSPSNIKKIIAYSKSKGKDGFPRLSYPVWRHMACNKLSFNEDIAWGLFSLFRCVSGEDSNAWIQEDEAWNKEPLGEARSAASVDLLRFVLFLFAQQLYKISLRSSLVSGEEWPSRAKSPDLDTRSTARDHKVLDDHQHLNFVQQHLNDMLELLVDPESLGAAPHEQVISLQAAEALQLLLAGSDDKTSAAVPLKDLLMLQSIQQKVGYSKISQTFSVHLLSSWIRTMLTQNPFGISHCIAAGKRLVWPAPGEDKESRTESAGSRRGKIATNAHLVPPDLSEGNKLIVVSQVNKQIIARSSTTLEGATLKLHRCHQSTIYLLSPLRSVTVDKCRGSTLVLGPVQTVLHINGCESMTVIAPCRQLIVSHSQRCTLHLLTPHKPIVTSDCSAICMGPYHTSYGSLQAHMQKAAIATTPNLWHSPIAITSETLDSSVWELMQPKDFFPFTIPFDMPGPTKGVPGGLPSKYSRSVQQRERQLDQWQRAVREAGLNREQRRQLQTLVEHRFQEWLLDTGAKRELDAVAAATTLTDDSNS